jgi:hypothetical protein
MAQRERNQSSCCGRTRTACRRQVSRLSIANSELRFGSMPSGARYASEAGSAVCPAWFPGLLREQRAQHAWPRRSPRSLPSSAHQVPESLILADLAPGLLQLWTRPQMPGHRLAARADLSDPRTPDMCRTPAVSFSSPNCQTPRLVRASRRSPAQSSGEGAWTLGAPVGSRTLSRRQRDGVVPWQPKRFERYSGYTTVGRIGLEPTTGGL